MPLGKPAKSIKRVLGIFKVSLTVHLMSQWHFNQHWQDSLGETLTVDLLSMQEQRCQQHSQLPISPLHGLLSWAKTAVWICMLPNHYNLKKWSLTRIVSLSGAQHRNLSPCTHGGCLCEMGDEEQGNLSQPSHTLCCESTKRHSMTLESEIAKSLSVICNKLFL